MKYKLSRKKIVLTRARAHRHIGSPPPKTRGDTDPTEYSQHGSIHQYSPAQEEISNHEQLQVIQVSIPGDLNILTAGEYPTPTSMGLITNFNDSTAKNIRCDRQQEQTLV